MLKLTPSTATKGSAVLLRAGSSLAQNGAPSRLTLRGKTLRSALATTTSSCTGQIPLFLQPAVKPGVGHLPHVLPEDVAGLIRHILVSLGYAQSGVARSCLPC